MLCCYKLKASRILQTSVEKSGIVRFVDIGGIIDHRCINGLFIIVQLAL
jgi:hypothetical protein